jgi:hypothetical protein
MDTFDMKVEPAIVEAIKEFQLQGAVLDHIDMRALAR